MTLLRNNSSGSSTYQALVLHLNMLSNLAYLASMPYGQSAMTMVNMGVYQNHTEKLAHWSILELIWFIG